MTRTKAILLIFVLVLLTYGNSLFNGFYGDAEGLFKNNTFYKNPSHLKFLFSKELVSTNQQLGAVFSVDDVAFSGMISYRPLTALSFFSDYFIWRNNAWGYHLTDLLLHFTCCVLVLYLALELTGVMMISLWAALFFATHPIHSEVVNSIAYRSDILGAILALGTFLSFNTYRKSEKWSWLIMSYLCLALSLLAKESAVILPILLWFYSCFVRRREASRPMRWGVWAGFVALVAIYLYIYLILIGNSFYPKFVASAGPAVRTMTALKSFVIYATAFLWPFKTMVLPPVYTPSIIGMTAAETIFGLSVIILLLWLMIKFWQRHRVISFCVLWFFISYLPISNLLTTLPNPLAFRFLYFPLIGLFILLAIFVHHWEQKLPITKNIIPCLLIVLNLCVTIPLNIFFKSTVTAAKEMIYNYPDSSRPYWNLAFSYYQQGKSAEARTYLQKYWEIDGRNPAILAAQRDPSVYILFARLEPDNHPRAIAFLKTALNFKPDDAVAYLDLAKRYILVNEYAEAEQSALAAMKLRPLTVMAYVYAVHSEIMSGKITAAESHLQQGFVVAPQDGNLVYLQNLLQEKKHAQQP